MRWAPLLAMLCLALPWLTGCAAGPNYHRPSLDPPQQFRGAEVAVGVASIGDSDWPTVFTDAGLRTLIATALANNLDLLQAVARIDEARAGLGLSDLALMPTLDATGVLGRAKSSDDVLAPGAPRFRNSSEAAVRASYEVDLWGRLRRGHEAARATLLATEYARRTVASTLVASVAADYYALLALDAQLETTRRTVASREKFVELTRAQHDRGYATGLDVATAEAQAAAARANVPDLERRIAQAENQLCVLLGENPHPIERTRLGEAMPEVPALPPAGLPAQLLDRRPDLRAAEASLRAANADVGAARAALFPAITLTGLAGSLSSPLGALFKSSTAEWSAAVNLVQPLLDPQRSRFQVDAANARKRQALYGYERAVRTAFQEVADALASYQAYGAYVEQQAQQVEALRKAQQIALARYRVGYAPYFDVINADRDLFAAELTLTQAHASGLAAYVRLYQVLGGGWTGAAPPAH